MKVSNEIKDWLKAFLFAFLFVGFILIKMY